MADVPLRREERGATRLDVWAGILLAAVTAVLIVLYTQPTRYMVTEWRRSDFSSHGPMVAAIAAFLIWRLREQLAAAPKAPDVRRGTALMALGLGVLLIGTLADVNPMRTFSLLPVIAGGVLYVAGAEVLRLLLFPIAFAVFMVPMEYLVSLTFPMQLLSAKLAAGMVGALGLPIEREGVNLTMGGFKFVVAIPCSGMRSLVSLLIIGSLFLYFSRTSPPRKVALFFLIFPIAILLNGYRIAMTCLLAGPFGDEAAKGVLHEALGIVNFGIAYFLLAGASKGLSALPWRWLGEDREEDDAPAVSGEPLAVSSEQEAGGRRQETADDRNPAIRNPQSAIRNLPSLLPALGVVAGAWAAITLFAVPNQAEAVSPHPQAGSETLPLNTVPLQLGGWQGEELPLDERSLDILQPDAHLSRIYRNSGKLDFAVLTMLSRNRRTFHPPEYCMQGTGWVTVARKPLSVEAPLGGSAGATTPLTVSQYTIEKGREREMMVYWFQCGNFVTTDNMRFLLYMTLRRLIGRRDYGMVVRLSAPLSRGEGAVVREARSFLRAFLPEVMKARRREEGPLCLAQQMVKRWGSGGGVLAGLLLIAPFGLMLHGLRSKRGNGDVG